MQYGFINKKATILHFIKEKQLLILWPNITLVDIIEINIYISILSFITFLYTYIYIVFFFEWSNKAMTTLIKCRWFFFKYKYNL